MKHFGKAVLVVASLLGGVASSSAYETYSLDRDTGNCATCHGNFRAPGYVSRQDSTPWGTDLMTGHNSMINSACGSCHLTSFFPTEIDESNGADGLSAESCLGCHGREETVDNGSEIIGVGLRQHHFRSGVTNCTGCHPDSDPSNFTPVAENVLPPNYFTPDPAHPDKPTDPCDANGSESVFGPTGLDNDGNDLYDLQDPACEAVVTGCPGDCNSDGNVTVNELVLMVNIALGTSPVSECSSGDANEDGGITVDELVTAVNHALSGCPTV